MSKTSDDAMLIGASWYPEMWPEDEWPMDIARMREIGFNMVRLFEFAWHRFEPREGEYDLGWALRVMDLCHEAGIAVMVGTPTPAPPAWLTSTYPDTLRTDAEGRRKGHGIRCHFSPHSRKYRELSSLLIERMAAALAEHPALHSWQIDNEMGGADFGPEARAAFHAWLEQRYGDIHTLNEEWGLEFWSQAYASFDQVPMPPVESPSRHHPSLSLANQHFQNDVWTDFIRQQCDILRAKSDKPITTNMVGNFGGMNWFQHNRLLDRVGTSMYKDVDHYHWNVMQFDRMRAEKPDRPYWHLETAPSWSGGGRVWNIHHSADGIRAMTWMSALLGGSMMLYWQWRQHWAGQEMLHGTLCTATGKWRPNREAIARIAAEWREHGEWLLAHPPAPSAVGLLISNEAAWAFAATPMEGLDYLQVWRDAFHQPLCDSHIWRDVIHESADLSKYKVLIIPLMPVLSKDTRRRLVEWVGSGGHLLLGPLTGFRTDEYTVFRDREFGGLEELMGAESALRFTVKDVEDTVSVEFGDGHVARVSGTCEGFVPTTGAVLADYVGGYGDGLPAIVENSFGAGTVTTLGGLVDRATYLKLVRGLLQHAGVVPVAEGDAHVVVVPRAGSDGTVAGYGIVNLKEQEQVILLPAVGMDLLTGEPQGREVTLPPLAVRLVRCDMPSR